MDSAHAPSAGGGPGGDSPTSHGFPVPRVPTAASVISSRLSNDGIDDSSPRPKTGASRKSRPESTRTSRSRSKSRKRAQHARTDSRGSAGAATPVPMPEPAVRSRNLSSRSHVPSLTSNAFFRPMSSQQLQAHRGSNRPPTMMSMASRPPTEPVSLDDAATDIGNGPMTRNSFSSNHKPDDAANQQQGHYGLQQGHPLPPSRGTDATNEQDRFTFNTSPTGHYAATGSQADSVRPLYNRGSDGNSNNRPGLSVDVDRSYRDYATKTNIPSPVRSPRSLRSGFLLSNRGDGNQGHSHGHEKLSSRASSRGPDGAGRGVSDQPPNAGGDAGAQGTAGAGKGRVWEYFDGNTRFLLGGRWQNTRGRPINIATGICILVPCIIFFSSSAPWLWHNISPAIPLIFAYLAYVCGSSFIHASVSDPGVS